MLKDIIIKTVEQKIMNYFLMKPDGHFYGREISKYLHISIGATSIALRNMEKAGLLSSERKGKTYLYYLNIQSAFLTRMKTLNSMFVIEPLLKDLQPLARKIILYGSYSEGTFTSDSDIDLLVVTEDRSKAIKIIDEFRRKSGLNINPVIKDHMGWMTLEKSDREYLKELNKGVKLWERVVDESRF